MAGSDDPMKSIVLASLGYNSEPILNQYCKLLPFLKQLFIGDVSLVVSDLEKYIFYLPGRSFDLKVKPGSQIYSGGAVHKSLAEKRRIVLKGDYHGLPCISVAIPIVDDNNRVIGSLSADESIERQETVYKVATKLSVNAETLVSTTEEIAAQTEEIASLGHELSAGMKEAIDRVAQTDDVLSIIKHIAGQINILGLNAAIEAARVGEHGKSFNVVANEIRNLASESLGSITKIHTILNSIKLYSTTTFSQMDEICNAIGQVAVAVNSVAESTVELSGMAHELDRVSKGMCSDQA